MSDLNIPEISWPSGYAKELFICRYNFENIPLLFGKGLSFEDSDVMGKIRFYFVETEFGPVLFYNHLNLNEENVTIYIDHFGQAKRIFNFLLTFLQINDVLWIRPVTYDD